MHKLLVLILSLLLTVAPVYGQAIPPTPTRPPTQGEVAAVLRESSDLIAQVGVTNFIAVALAVGAVVVTGLFIWFFVRPLLKSNTAANQQIASMSAQGAQAQLLTAQSLERTAQEQGRLANILTTLSTKSDDETRTNAAAVKIAKDVNAHTDEAIKPAVEDSNEAVAELKKLSDQMKSLVTQTHFDGAMEAVQKQLDSIIEKMERTPQPSPAPTPPPEIASAEHGSIGEVEKE